MPSRKKKTAPLQSKQDNSTNPNGQAMRPAVESLETRQLLSAAAASSTVTANSDLIASAAAARTAAFTGYTPAQIKAAYGFNQVSDDGTGQTIAIVDAFDDPNIVADLHAFDVKYGLPDTTITKVSETGGSTKGVQANADWASEIALDVEWAHAIAPGAKIDLVEASSDSITDLMAAVDVARRLNGVSVVSMSWGSSEFTGESYFDKYFTTPKGHTGVTFVAASGDEGSAYGPSYPATSDYVLAVGGTTLNLTSSGAYSSESGWLDGTGGFSSLEAEPSYQAGVQTTGVKITPDVSYDANPSTGFAVYDSYGSGGWTVVGGTSAGAPQWAALVALADQARVANGAGTLDGATGTLPALYKLYTASTYTSSFHDITTGGSAPFYPATAGFDAATGLGTPEAASVVSALTSATSTPLTTISATTSRRRSSARTARAAIATRTTEDTMPSNAALAQSTPAVFSLMRGGAPAVFNALVGAEPATAVPQQAASAAATGEAASASESGPAMRAADWTSTPAAAPRPVDFEIWPAGATVDAAGNAGMSIVPLTPAEMDSAAAFAGLASLLARDVSAPAASGFVAVTEGAAVPHTSTAAWATTLAVLAADAVLVGYWYNQAGGKRRRPAMPPSPFYIEPVRGHGDE